MLVLIVKSGESLVIGVPISRLSSTRGAGNRGHARNEASRYRSASFARVRSRNKDSPSPSSTRNPTPANHARKFDSSEEVAEYHSRPM